MSVFLAGDGILVLLFYMTALKITFHCPLVFIVSGESSVGINCFESYEGNVGTGPFPY